MDGLVSLKSLGGFIDNILTSVLWPSGGIVFDKSLREQVILTSACFLITVIHRSAYSLLN